jgi:hypothetical protein
MAARANLFEGINSMTVGGVEHSIAEQFESRRDDRRAQRHLDRRHCAD